MNVLIKNVKSIIYIFSAILAGVCLFLALFGLSLEKTLYSPEYHKQLFLKNKIYEHTHTVVTTSMSDFISNLQKTSPQNYEQHKDIFPLLEKSTTAEMVNKNLDAIRDGVFAYFKGVKRFLPDIYLNSFTESEKTAAIDPNQATLAAQALTRVEKINLGAILQYIDRTDIIDYLSILKFLYFAVNAIPGFLLLILVILCLGALMVSAKFLDMTKWLRTLFITFGLLALASGICLFIYTWFIVPGSIYPLTISLPLHGDVIISYIRGSLFPLSIFFVLIGILSFSLTACIYFLQRYLPTMVARKLQAQQASVGYSSSAFKGRMQDFVLDKSSAKKRLSLIIMNTLFALSILAVLTTIGYKYSEVKKDFNDNDFHTVMQKMRGVSTVTEVIAAKDDSIYDVQVKILDDKTGKPISNVQLAIVGRASINKKDFSETSLTDASGSARFSLDRGSFRISFNPSTFPSQYVMPTPIFFDIKAAGAKIITINLESVQNKLKWGIVEVEVMDKDNKPVSNLELAIPDQAKAPGNPDALYSQTNSEGIAVFKVYEGEYTVHFTEAKFPKKYQLPPGIRVTATYNTVNRFTFRLVDAAPVSTPTPSATPAKSGGVPSNKR